jgi:hypothetical protein
MSEVNRTATRKLLKNVENVNKKAEPRHNSFFLGLYLAKPHETWAKRVAAMRHEELSSLERDEERGTRWRKVL